MNECYWINIFHFCPFAPFLSIFDTFWPFFGQFSVSSSINDSLTTELNCLLNWIIRSYFELNNSLHWILGNFPIQPVLMIPWLLNWIIFWIEWADFFLNWIIFWIESLVKQYWIEYWMNHFLAKFKYWIESDWVSFTTTRSACFESEKKPLSLVLQTSENFCWSNRWLAKGPCR